MGCQEAESLARAKGHPHFIFLVQGACQSHCLDDNIGVDSADGDLAVASVSGVLAACSIMRLSASSCVHGVVLWCPEDGISLHDDQLLVCNLEGVE